MTYASPHKYGLIGKETTWGTAVTADKDVGLITDISDSLAREVQEIGSISSVETQKITSGLVDVSESMTVTLQHGRLFEYIFGSVAHVETTGDWKHTFTVASAAPSFTLESGENLTTDTVLTHAGLLIDSAKVSTELNNPLKLQVELKGKTTASTSSASSAVISTLPVFSHSMTHVSINSVEASEVQSFDINITKEVALSGGVGSNIYQQGHAMKLRIEFSGQLGYTDKIYQELFLGGTSPSATSDPTAIPVEINAHNGVVLGSGRREIKVALSDCIFSKFDKVASEGGLIFVDVAGHGKLSEAFSVDNISSASW